MSVGYLIGVDIGTYSAKGVLVKTDGAVVASHTVPHEMAMPRPGFFEHDADGVWWHDFRVIIKNLFQKSGAEPKQVLGIGTSAIGSCVLPIDEKGRPLRPGILYGIDTRATEEIVYLERELGKVERFKESGLHLDGWKINRRQVRHRQLAIGHQAEHHDAEREQRGRCRAANENSGQVHDASTEDPQSARAGQSAGARLGEG